VYTAPVGHYKANPFGLYDMTGNVSEWCGDWYDAGYYANSPKADPSGPRTGDGRVSRGRSWCSVPAACRCAVRGLDEPGGRDDGSGFRVAVGTP
jgi:formylglycine-generating enzyme required for sulfatase activity